MIAQDLNIPEYQIKEELFRSDRTTIYRAIWEKNQQVVVLKILNNKYPSNQEIALFRHEFLITKKMAGDGVINAHDQIKSGNRLALILEDFDGRSLHEYLTHKGLKDLTMFLRLAIDLCKSLGYIHKQHVIHKDINPGNILFNGNTKKSQIIDFGISSELSRQHQDVSITNKLEGSLAYISPEQTGRMNRKIDYRTDYYSLGITLYETLTGSLPFKAEDTIGWIHCHIAKKPPSPHELDSSIPEVVSNIMMRLMSKNAEDRYQSSIGIIRDLEECIIQLEQTRSTKNSISNFELGRWDIPESFQTPQKLLGREKELELLTNTFENVAQGACEYLLVSGYSGVGKSVLVHEVHKPIVGQKGYFIDGKFDQFQRDIPYGAFIQTFQGLVNQLLSERSESMKRWKTLLLDGIHANGQIIIDLIPEVEKIIGKQPPVQELNPTETQNRFFITFKNFIQVFAQKEHPLVIFLDDLQWSDIPTLKLIEYLLTAGDLSYFFLIGAFRSNEVNEVHPLTIVLDDIEKTTSIRRLNLHPLKESYINELVAQTVHCDLETTDLLSSLIYKKTEGNPFFVKELLLNLYQEGLFTFNERERHWDWNLEKISAMNVTDNVVEFMIQRLRKLPKDTQNALQIAACVGNLFDLKTLAIIHEQSLSATNEILLPAIHEGIIVPLNDQYRLVHLQKEGAKEQNLEESDFGVSYKFQHDRVQQAAYSLLGEKLKQELHLKIARLLQAHTTKENLEERLIEMVRHFNAGKELIDDEKEQRSVLLLNLRAGRKAKRSAAYPPAFEYLSLAKELLPENPWTKAYGLCFDVHKEYADCAYLSGELEIAEEASQVLLHEAKSKFEKVRVYRMLVLQYSLVGRLEDAVRVGISALSLLGMKVSMEPSQFTVLKEVLMAKWNLGKRSVESLIDEPLLKDPEKRIAMRILIALAPPAYILGLENLFAVVVLKQVNLSLRLGNSPEAAYAYCVYAILLNGALGDFKQSYNFGKLAVKLNEKLNDMEFRCRILYIYTNFVHCWNHHWKTTYPIYKKTMEVGLQTGDLLYTGYTTFMLPKLNTDLSLNEMVKLAERTLVIAVSSKYLDVINIGQIYQQYRLNLMGKTEGLYTLNDANFNEEECMATMRQHKNSTGIGIQLLTKIKLFFIYHEIEQGLKLIPELEMHIKAQMGTPESMEYCFYTFMTFGAAYTKMNKKEKRSTLKTMKKKYKQMRKWHDHYAINSAHFVFMMDAEFARMANDLHKAISFLEKAIDAAATNGFIEYKAMANELLGMLYISQNKKKIAGLYLSDAYYAYQIWGATRKMDFLKKHYKQYFILRPSQTISAADPHQTTMSTTIEGAPAVDMSTVTKAAETIFSEVVLEKLLKKLMEIVRENAGAEKAILLLPGGKEQELLIQAKSLGMEEVEVLTAEKPEDSSQVSLGIINYVARSLKYVLLGDAAQEGKFINDPYVEKYQPKSVLSMPILNQGKLVGVLYLENNIASFAFSSNRLEILTMLSAQAAISIENALLYQNLEEKVRDRTKALNEANEEINLINENLEKLVLQRTEKIEEQNKKLVGYAFSNAHKVRGPLAQVLGLAYIMKELNPQSDEIPEYLEKLHQAATKLDIVVRGINKQLEEGSTEEKDKGI